MDRGRLCCGGADQRTHPPGETQKCHQSSFQPIPPAVHLVTMQHFQVSDLHWNTREPPLLAWRTPTGRVWCPDLGGTSPGSVFEQKNETSTAVTRSSTSFMSSISIREQRQKNNQKRSSCLNLLLNCCMVLVVGGISVYVSQRQTWTRPSIEYII